MSTSSESAGASGTEGGSSGGYGPVAAGVPPRDDAATVDLNFDVAVGAEGVQPSVQPEPGTVVGCHYLLEQLVGRGATSSVYRARDLRPVASAGANGNLVAVKFLHGPRRIGQGPPARLYREFHTMRRLAHANIARVFELACEGDLWFMSMELIAGQTLKAWMSNGAGTHAQATHIIEACCAALEYAHSRGIVHGDLQPTNVLVSDDGAVKLIDFGSSSMPGAGSGADSTVAATPLYASPQILAGQRAEQRDDVFSLACLSYSILSGGRHPYGGHPSFEGLRAKSAPTYVSAIPIELFEVIERGLSADRAQRPASVSEFWRKFTAADQLCRSRARVSPADSNGIKKSAPDAISPVPAAVVSSVGRGARRLFPPRMPRISPVALALIALMVLVAGGATLAKHRARGRSPSVSAEIPRLPAPAPQPSVLPLAPIPDLAPPAPSKAAPLPHDSTHISFKAALIHASAGQPLVAITVRRTPANGRPGPFVWRVERGTAIPAIDYERIKPQRAEFIEGQSVRTLFIPLLTNSASHVPRGPLFFDVVLQPVAGGPALGPLARITVVIDPMSSVWVASSQPRSSAFRQ
ncbi:MAG TPA: serine/threonine-protein kinase [Steroidobacteraceae bacterium]|nr:serine/threonine-protein kinase [Steroidobacteraceae bacterium]